MKSNETTSTQEDGNAEFSEETRSENDSSVEEENTQFTSVVQVNVCCGFLVDSSMLLSSS